MKTISRIGLLFILSLSFHTVLAQDVMSSDTLIEDRPELTNDSPLYFIPNAFTPNSSGLNDIFKPVMTEGVDPYDFHLVIFNRKGQIVFESYDADYGWDGNYGNNPAESNIYVWKLTFGELESDVKHFQEGHVFLMR
jgi:gliding motility-associated-like protein